MSRQTNAVGYPFYLVEDEAGRIIGTVWHTTARRAVAWEGFDKTYTLVCTGATKREIVDSLVARAQRIAPSGRAPGGGA